MADINASIQLLSKTASWFATNDPLLLDGQAALTKDLMKLKVGNGVDNWSELPYLSLTPSEISTLLSGKVDNSTFSTHEGAANPHETTLEDVRAAGNGVDGDINMSGNAILNLPAPTTQNEPIRKIDFDTYVSEVGGQRDSIDCSTNPNYPPSNKGDRWEVSAAGKIGGASGVNVQIWDEIVCKVDSAGGDQATAGDDFYVVQGNIERATESTSGYLMLASTADAESFTDDEKAMTSLKTKKFWDKVKTLAQTFAESITFTKAPVMSELNASKFVKTASDKKLTSVDIAINDISNATDVGKALLALVTPATPVFLRVNADGTVSVLTSAEMKASIGLNRTTLTDDVSTTTNTYSDVTGLLFAVENGKTYRFQFWITFSTSNVTNGSRWSLTFPSGDMSYRTSWDSTTTTRSFSNANTAADLPASPSGTTAALNGNTAIVEGVFKATANGNVQLRFAAEVSTFTITAKGGKCSYVEWEEL